MPCPETPHWCGRHRQPDPFCNAPHPDDEDVFCRRQSGHDGDHSACTFSIMTPATWRETL
jgi:hypothetical protein